VKSSELKVLPDGIQEYIQSLENRNESLESKVDYLTEQLRLVLFKKYGRSSEKLDVSQLTFFEEPDEELEEAELSEIEEVIVQSYPRKKSGRKALDPNLPRERIIHDISDEDKICGCGCELSKIDEEITERLQIIPEQIYVEQHVRFKYACRNCEGSGDEDKPVFRIAPSVPSIIPGSIITPGLLSFILVNKFCDHLPFYRQEKRFDRIGVKISRQDMSNWSIKAYQALLFLEELFIENIKKGPVINMDETTVQVMGEEDRADTCKSYMWLARGGPPETPIVYYKYHPRRNSKYISDFLDGFKGFVQADGYKAYDTALKDNEDITLVGCMAHARRKFFDASLGTKKKAGSTQIALTKIKEFYRIEKELKELDLSPEEFQSRRKILIAPVAEDFKSWLKDKSVKVRPSSKLGEAVSYTLGQWEKIISYLETPYLTPDNNAAERAIRPFVVGRKNWLFSKSPKGAEASCFFFSLIETAKENDLNPYGYLKHLFEMVPLLKTKDDYEAVFPWNCDRKEVNRIPFHGL
jgi:transposase